MPEKFPVRNLPDAAEPWGRYIEGAVSNLQSAIDLLAQKTGNSNGSLNTSYDNIATQLQALTDVVSRINTPVTGTATSTSTSFPLTVTVPIVVPDGCTRAYFIQTAVMDAQASTAFHIGMVISAPISGVGGVGASASAWPETGSASTVRTGVLTGLIPGDTINFSSVTGSIVQGSITTSRTTGSVLAIFSP